MYCRVEVEDVNTPNTSLSVIVQASMCSWPSGKASSEGRRAHRVGQFAPPVEAAESLLEVGGEDGHVEVQHFLDELQVRPFFRRPVEDQDLPFRALLEFGCPPEALVFPLVLQQGADPMGAEFPGQQFGGQAGGARERAGDGAFPAQHPLPGPG